MTAKRIFGIAYHVLEVAVLIFFTVLILLVRFNGEVYDRADYLDQWGMCLIGAAFLFFVSIPIILIYLVSFFRSLPFRSVWQKVILCGHVMNIILWIVLYFTLPKATLCTAAEMEQHYLSHQTEIHNLIDYINSCLDDSTVIKYETRQGREVNLHVISRKGGGFHFCYMSELSQMDSILQLVGISPTQFDTIRANMDFAGILGFDIEKSGFDKHTYLVYKWYGQSCYRYKVGHGFYADQLDEDTCSAHFIYLNDSVKFESTHNMVGHGFPDWKQYVQKHSN